MQVEIDERVTRLAEKYFPELCESNGDPRAELLFIDGIKYMKDCEPESLDVVIVDSTDPVGPAEGLFNADFYKTCFEALKPERHPRAAVRIAARASGPHQVDADRDAHGRFPGRAHADFPATVLSDRLVELHDGAQGRRSRRIPRARRGRPSSSRRATTTPRFTRLR